MFKGKKLYRSHSNRVITGVCAGIGEYIGTDPVFVRLVFLALGVLTNLGPAVVLYILLTVFIPERPQAGAAEHQVPRDVTEQPSADSRAEHVREWMRKPANLVGLIIIVIGIVGLTNIYVPSIMMWAFVWPALLVVIGGYLLWKNRRS